MYKLLLAVNRPEIKAAFQTIPSWELMGFRRPRVVEDADQAIEVMKRHRLDGVVIGLDPEGKGAMMRYLNEYHPDLPVILAPEDGEQFRKAAVEMDSLLNRINADYSDDNSDKQEMLRICRHDYLRRMLSGEIADSGDLRAQLLLLRSRMDPGRPCVVVDLTLLNNEDFMTDRWHYGPERLETALRNFFGAELDGRRMVVSVLSNRNARLLCCPMFGCDSDDSGMMDSVTEHARSAIAQVGKYLGLELEMAGARYFDTMYDLVGSL